MSRPTLVSKPLGKGMITVRLDDPLTEDMAGPAAVESDEISLHSLDVQSGGDIVDGVPNFRWKILVIGDIAVGKSALIKRMVHNLYTDRYKSTIGVDFALKKLAFSNAMVYLQLWDIGGQERFGNMTRIYYKDAVAVIVVCDNRLQSRDSVRAWVDDVRGKDVRLPDGETPVPILMLSTKSDLPCEYDTGTELEEYAKELGCFGVARVSAKTGDAVPGALIDLCAHLCRIRAWHNPDADADSAQPTPSGIIKLSMQDGDRVIPVGDETTLSTVTLIGDPYNTQNAAEFARPRRKRCCDH